MLIFLCSTSFSFLFELLFYIIPIFHMENPTALYAVQICTGRINYAQAGELISLKGQFIALGISIFPFLMLVWAIGNWHRVYRFKQYNDSALWKYRYR